MGVERVASVGLAAAHCWSGFCVGDTLRSEGLGGVVWAGGASASPSSGQESQPPSGVEGVGL